MSNEDKHLWYALYTKPRAEKKTEERLRKSGVTTYLPLQETVREWSDRKKKVLVPIIPSYIFVRINYERDHLDILQDPGAAFFVYWLGKPAAISDREIEEMRNFLEENEEVKIEEIQHAVGKEVRVIHGALKNKRGIVLRVDKNNVHLQIFALGMQLSAEMHPSKIELIKNNS